MNTAIRSRKDFRSGNTGVNSFTCGATGRLGAIVKLHGNKIAEIYNNSVVLFDGGWQTTTTKSRLNALCDYFCIDGEGVFQKDFQWYVRKFVGCINGKNIFQTEDFESGYTFA